MKYLVVEPFAGLGNRLRALVSAMRIAKKLNRQLAVIWTLDSYHLWCPFQNLFDNPFVFVTEHFLQNAIGIKYFTIGMEPNYLLNCDDDIIFVREENFFWLTGDTDVMWGQFPPSKMKNTQLRDELKAEFDALKPNRQILSKVNDFCDTHLPGSHLGVHVRREDNAWSNKYCHESFFVSSILKNRPRFESKIFVATDSEATQKMFEKRFGNAIVCYPVRSLSRGLNQHAIEDALTIMLILSRTSLILRSCSSSFSQVAAWFGDVKTVEIGKIEHRY